MKRFLSAKMGVLLMLILINSLGCQTQSDVFTGTVSPFFQKTTLEEANTSFRFAIPVPSYLPDSYKIQDIYIWVQDNSVYFLISDGKIEKNIVTPIGEVPQYEFRCQMDIRIKWYNRGISGSLKLPGERPDITPTQGITEASVIVDNESTNTLWWDWRPNYSEPGMYEIIITAIKQISKEDLVRITESIQLED